jgi:hypothetical protein
MLRKRSAGARTIGLTLVGVAVGVVVAVIAWPNAVVHGRPVERAFVPKPELRVPMPMPSGVRGTVFDTDGKPLIGVPLHFGSATTMTDREGSFQIGLPPGGYHVRVDRPGTKAIHDDILVTADTVSFVRIVAADRSPLVFESKPVSLPLVQ